MGRLRKLDTSARCRIPTFLSLGRAGGPTYRIQTTRRPRTPLALLQVPAIVIGRGMTALGVMRCLCRRGIDTYVSCDDDLVPRSRFFQPTVTRDGQRWQTELGEAGYEFLRNLPVDRGVVIPCADDIAMWLSELPPDLASRYVHSNPPHDALVHLQDKREFGKLCAELDIPHPRCCFISSAEDIDAIPFDEIERVFLKPSNSVPFMARFGVKGMWVSDRSAAHAVWSKVADHDLDVLAQEYVAGGADDHYFIDGFRDRNGIVRGLLARRRHRIFPRDFGNSCYCESVPLEDVDSAWQSLLKILKHVRYHGIFSAEFKQDAMTGEFKILEVNTRAWVYVEFAARCGLDVPELAYRHALELPLQNHVVSPHVAGCVDLLADLRCYREMPYGQRSSILRVAKQWVRGHKAIFAWDDPMPFCVQLHGMTSEWLARRIFRKRAAPPEMVSASCPKS